MKAIYILLLLIFPVLANGNYQAQDRYCSKNINKA
ncbi:hypothetical protein PSOS111911_20405 [Pseudoalteromonas ostreae]